MADKRDPHLVAVDGVFAALKDLNPESRNKVLASVAALLDLRLPAAATPRESQPSTGAETKISYSRPLSLIELMQQKKPTTYSQMLAVFAYYREKFEGKPRFGRNDLKDYFSKAKERPPGNYDRDFGQTVRLGWIHEDGDQSYLTSKGVEVVETGFSGERRSDAAARKSAKNAAKKSKKKSSSRKQKG